MKPCKRGHTGGRYASGQCIECHKLRKGPNRRPPATRLEGLERETIRANREEQKARKLTARNEAAAKRIEKRELQAKERETELKHFAELERARILKRRMTDAVKQQLSGEKIPTGPTLTIRGNAEVMEATAKYERRDQPAPPAEVQPAPPRPDDVRPIWMREGRQPTREEWLEHQRTRGAVHKQAFAGSSSQTDWFVRACEARNRGFR